MYNYYDDFLKQMKLPDARIVNENGEILVQTDNSSTPLDSYLENGDNHEQSLLTELHTFLELGNFSFNGLHNSFGNKEQKNRELEQQLEFLVAKMSQTSDLKDLEKLHNEAKDLVKNMHSGILGDHMQEAIDYLDKSKMVHRDDLDGKYYVMDSLVSGANIDMIKQMISSGYIERDLIKAYVDAMYESRKQQFTIRKEAESVREKGVQPGEVVSEVVEEAVSNNVVLEENGNDARSNLEEQRVEFIERRSQQQLRHDELLEERRLLESDATIDGLFDTESYDRPIYRKHPNPVDGDIVGYETETRYVNGSDEDRKEYENKMRELEAEIKKVEEAIEVLSKNISDIDEKIARIEPKATEISPAESPKKTEARIFGIAKLKNTLAGLFGKRNSLDKSPEKKASEELDELLDSALDEIKVSEDDSAKTGRLY